MQRSRAAINSELLNLAIAIESINSQMVQLMIEKDELQRVHGKLSEELKQIYDDTTISDSFIGQQMVFGLLKSEVGLGGVKKY